MNALTFRPPWGTLCFLPRDDDCGMVKQIETRKKPVGLKVSERFAIHQGLEWDSGARAIIEEMEAAWPGDEDEGIWRALDCLEHYREPDFPRGVILGTARVDEVRPLVWADSPRSLCWAEGLTAYVLADPIMFAEPVLARGNQGLWRWDPRWQH